METKTVYFVRHGQSVDNALSVFQSTETPLSSLGQTQAEKIAKRISNLTFDGLVASSLPRAKQTALAIAEATGHQPVFSGLLVERIKPTSINGKPFSDDVAQATWRQWEESMYTPGAQVEDGESYDKVIQRADDALAWLGARPESSLVAVTHGFFLRTVMARVLLAEGLDPATLRNIQKNATMENTGLTVMRFEPAFEDEPAWRLTTYNDQAHLADW